MHLNWSLNSSFQELKFLILGVLNDFSENTLRDIAQFSVLNFWSVLIKFKNKKLCCFSSANHELEVFVEGRILTTKTSWSHTNYSLVVIKDCSYLRFFLTYIGSKQKSAIGWEKSNAT